MPEIGDIREETQTDPVLGTRRVRSVYVAPGIGWKIEEALSEWVQPEKKMAWQEKYEKAKIKEEPVEVPLSSGPPYYTTPGLPLTEVPIVKKVTQVVTVTPKKEEADLLETLFGFLPKTGEKAAPYRPSAAVPFAPAASELAEQFSEVAYRATKEAVVGTGEVISDVSKYFPEGLVTGKIKAAPIPFAPIATEVVSRTKEALGREDVYTVGGPIETYIKKGISEQMKEEGEFKPPPSAVPVEMESFAPRYASLSLFMGKEIGLKTLEFLPTTAYGAGLLLGRAAKGEPLPGLVGEVAAGFTTLVVTPFLMAPAMGKFLGQKDLTQTEIQEAEVGFESYSALIAAALGTRIISKSVGKVKQTVGGVPKEIYKGLKGYGEDLLYELESRTGIQTALRSPDFIKSQLTELGNIFEEFGGPRRAQFTSPSGLGAITAIPSAIAEILKRPSKSGGGYTRSVSPATSIPSTSLDLSWLAGFSEIKDRKDMYDFTTKTISVQEYGTPLVIPGQAVTRLPEGVTGPKPLVVELVEIKPEEKPDYQIVYPPEEKEKERILVIPAIPQTIIPEKEIPRKKPPEDLPKFFEEEPYKTQRLFKPIKISKQPTRYVPSFAAMALGITAKRKPRFVSGFELRPIILGKTKPTKRTKQKKEKPLSFGMQLPTMLMKKGKARSSRSGLSIPSTLGSNLFGIKKGGVRLRSLR